MAVTAIVNASNTDNRFVVTDISNPTHVTSVYVTAPFNTGETYTQGCVVDCYGKLAAVGSYQTGSVALYDLTNPAQPSQVSLIDTGFAGIGAISINGSRVLVGEATGPHIALIDVSNPGNPQIVSSQIFVGLGDQDPPGITGLGLVGLIAIASDNFSAVVLDYSNISSPQQLPYINYKINFQGPIVCAFDGFTAAVGDASGSVYLLSVPNGAQGPITLENQFGSVSSNVTSIAIQGDVVAACSSSSVFAQAAYLAPKISSPPNFGQLQISSGGGDSGGAVKFYGLPANLATCGQTAAEVYPPPPAANTVTWFSTSNWPNAQNFNSNPTGSNTSSPSLNAGLVYTLGVASFLTIKEPWWTWIWKIIAWPFRLIFG
jgi:hypothetical protein